MATTSSTVVERSECYTLSSELARACLPQAGRDEERKFAWTAAVCLLFLAVGIHGLFTQPVFTVPTPVPAEETIPVLFEPPPPPQPVDNAPTPESPEPDLNESVAPPPPPPLVVAVANPAEAAFSVSVKGPVIIASARLASPPPIDLQAASTSAP